MFIVVWFDGKVYRDVLTNDLGRACREAQSRANDSGFPSMVLTTEGIYKQFSVQ